MIRKTLLTIAIFCGVGIFALFHFQKKYEHELTVCAVFKNEAPYLKEWIDYHHQVLGASRFYLYNNDSTDGYQEILDPYIKAGLVELIQWESSEDHALRGWIEGAPWNAYQIGAYNNCLKEHALGKAQWVAMIDIDEYIVPIEGLDAFHSTLKKASRPWPFSSVGSLKVHWRVFGTSHVWDLEPGERLIEKLVMRAKDDHGWNRKQVKSIHRPEALDICLIHHAKLYKKYKVEELSPKHFNVHHYWTGTEKRLREKRWDGSEERLFPDQFNCVEDRTIHKYLPLIQSQEIAASD